MGGLLSTGPAPFSFYTLVDIGLASYYTINKKRRRGTYLEARINRRQNIWETNRERQPAGKLHPKYGLNV